MSESSERADHYKQTLGRSRCRWNDSVKRGLTEVGYNDMEWIHLALNKIQWPAVVKAVMSPRVV
jgi:hypothetical protein